MLVLNKQVQQQLCAFSTRPMNTALILIIFILTVFFPSSSTAQNPVTLNLDDAINQALLANPNLSAMEARARAIAEIPGQQGSLPDPQLSLRAANLPMDTFALDQEAMTQLQIALSQALPFPGKLSLRQQIAEFESQSANFNLEQQRLMLIQDVKMVWWNLYYLDRALETVIRNQELFRQLNTVAQTKYQVGKGLQQDVLMAQLELSKLLDNEISLNSMRENESIRLNTLLDQPADTEITLPELEHESILDDPDSTQLLSQALLSSPVIMDQKNKMDAARTRVKLVEKNFYPDFMLGATYGYRQGENPNGSDRADFASLSITINLPFFNLTEKKSAVSQRKHELFQQVQSLKSSENSVQAAVLTALSDFNKSSKEVELLETGIIPQAKQTLDSIRAGYQVDKVDFLNLVQAQTSLYNYETRYWKSFCSANQALARLAAATGKEDLGE